MKSKNIKRGITSVLKLFPNTDYKIKSFDYKKDPDIHDVEALQSDFIAIGFDLKEAIHEQEQKDKKGSEKIQGKLAYSH